MKVIAFSLWGNDPKYTLGAIQNASLAKIVYPGWICRFYIGQSTPEHIINLLQEFDNVEIVMQAEQGDWSGMFWRFEAASDPDIDVLIVRDCDSRLWFREARAVEDWLSGPKDFHVMRDHEYHATPILGGMWGVRNKLLLCMDSMLDTYPKGNYWQTDQEFLKQRIWPLVGWTTKAHDEFYGGTPFPGERDPNHFVGQSYAGSGRILDGTEYFQDFVRREICPS
jgi:hypothetical protein